jgi:N-acetylglucosamine kinase-like BadF-type ATPase
MGAMTTGAGPEIVLAVDGGGSKTDVVAVGLDGSLLAHARGAGSNPQVFGLPESVELVLGLVERVRDAVGPHSLARAGVYLAGLDLPAEIVAFRGAVEGTPAVAGLRDSALLIDNDLFALLRAGAATPDAVAVVCGTGLNAVATRADGATARFPALGPISGDWGGGGSLGMQALWHAVRSGDGRGPKSVLETLVPESFGVGSIMEVVEGLHFGRIPQRAVAHLTPVLFEAARRGDQPALAEIERQAGEILTMADVAMRRLGIQTRAPRVVLGGGVLAASDPLLLDPVLLGLAELAPGAEVTLVTTPPIVGAALLVLESVGAAPEAVAAARAAIVERFERDPADYEESTSVLAG